MPRQLPGCHQLLGVCERTDNSEEICLVGGLALHVGVELLDGGGGDDQVSRVGVAHRSPRACGRSIRAAPADCRASSRRAAAPPLPEGNVMTLGARPLLSSSGCHLRPYTSVLRYLRLADRCSSANATILPCLTLTCLRTSPREAVRPASHRRR